ncbi:MAG: hypothetical protein RSC50_00705, partial [Aurantimicrobium sp.]
MSSSRKLVIVESPAKA